MGTNMQPAHVAFIITRGDAVGGATIHVRDLASALRANGARATVLVGGDGEALREFERCGVPHWRVPALARSIHPWRDAVAIAQLTSALRDLRPSLVSTHTSKAGLLGRIAAKAAGIPALYTPHGWTISDRISRAGGRVFRFAERAAAPLADSIVNVCEAERALALNHRIGRVEQMAVIHNGVRDVAANQWADASLDPPRILMVARFEPPKDHETLLESLAGLAHMPWTLELVGGGPGESAVREQVKRLGLQSRVDFVGASSNVADRMGAAQLFVLSSRSEGFPRSILEAMRAGLPVVASDVGGVSESVAHGATGLVVPRGNRQVLRDALATLIGSGSLRVRYGRAGRLRYQGHFTFQRMFDQTLRLYQEILNKHAGSVPARMEGL